MRDPSQKEQHRTVMRRKRRRRRLLPVKRVIVREILRLSGKEERESRARKRGMVVDSPLPRDPKLLTTLELAKRRVDL